MAKSPGRSRASMMLWVRTLHTWLGAFVAPSVMFLSITGGLQVFSLHEAHGDYTPPAWIATLSHVHKDQVWNVKPRAPPPAAGAHPDDDHGPAAGSPEHHDRAATPVTVLALKWLFVVVAAAMTISTLFGLWMGLTVGRHKRAVLALFLLGAVLPLGLLFLEP